MKDNLKQTWDKHARSRIKFYPKADDLKNSKDFIINWLKNIPPKDKKLLDDGCGIGQYVLSANRLGFKSQGLDISPDAVKIAKENGLNVIEGDMRDLPLKNNSFDIVIAGGSLEHFPETQKGINEIYRVLKPNGILLGNVPERYSIFPIVKKAEQLCGIWKMGYEKSFSKRKFKKMLEKAGFKVIEFKRNRIGIGKNKLVGYLIRLLDEPFYLLGAGGAHFYFRAIKNE